MGARHARFRPFCRPRSGENLGITPRWYGADRRAQQGQPPVLQGSCSEIAAHRPGRNCPRLACEKRMIFGCGGAPKPGHGAGQEHWAVTPAPYCRRPPRQHRQTALDGRGREAGGVAAKTPIHRRKAIRRAMHRSRTRPPPARAASSCDILQSGRSRARRRRRPSPSHAPRSDELQAGGHSRELIYLLKEDLRHPAAALLPVLTICRRRWR